jgi:hypothetical protein
MIAPRRVERRRDPYAARCEALPPFRGIEQPLSPAKGRFAGPANHSKPGRWLSLSEPIRIYGNYLTLPANHLIVPAVSSP